MTTVSIACRIMALNIPLIPKSTESTESPITTTVKTSTIEVTISLVQALALPMPMFLKWRKAIQALAFSALLLQHPVLELTLPKAIIRSISKTKRLTKRTSRSRKSLNLRPWSPVGMRKG